jgi:hypothetical protein
MQKAFESVGQVHELKLLTLERQKIEMETAVREIGSALESPHVSALPVLGLAFRRFVQAREKIEALESDIAAARQKLLAFRSRESRCRELFDLLRAQERRSAVEREGLETVGVMMRSSLWQDSNG